ncbi:MAG: hypothetical protein JXA82_06830 [Sedimentisphaerales bacterium]|nr:hypothetical protein [Sedimentisphaerales bacterium]
MDYVPTIIHEPRIALGRLTQLASTPGVSGREDDVARLIVDQITPFVDSVTTDPLGNVIARREGKGPVLMMEAHMDEVGFMVQGIEGSFIRFLQIGPILQPPVIGQRMHLHTRHTRIEGVVGYNHDCDSIYLDIGHTEDEIADLVQVGDIITFKDGVTSLGNGLIAGKAMDNRTGVFALLETARNLAETNVSREVVFGFSVRHEVGALGIPALVSAVQPRQAIVVDVALASDYPHGAKNRLGKTDLGEGPVLWRGVDLSESMSTCLANMAEENMVPYQRAAWNVFTPTNASHVMKIGPAVQTTLVSIPHRYPHGPCSVVSTDDISGVIRLLSATVVSQDLQKSFS